MRNKILELITTKPKHYAMMVNKSREMKQWVMENSLIAPESHISWHIRSAVYGENNICPNGKIKPLLSAPLGWNNCGNGKNCACSKKAISDAVKDRVNNTDEQKAITKQRRSDTMVEKYGHAYNSQRPEVKLVLNKNRLPADVQAKLDSKIWLEHEYVTNKRTSVDIAKELGIHNSTVLDYCVKHGFEIRQRACYSMTEVEVVEFLKSHGFNPKEADRSILTPYELDIYLPDNNLAIEINGLYWHSFVDPTTDQKNKHLWKTTECEKQNIQLLHITDYEWKYNKEIIQSIILSKLGKTTKIHARKCSIKIMNTVEAKTFFGKYHLQGYCAGKYYIGLEFNGDVVEAITVGKNRFGDGHELIRMASIFNTTVVGGVSKLMKYMMTIIDTDLYSYADRQKSTGKGYKSSGFIFVKDTKPGFYWTDGDRIKSRYTSQSNDVKLLPTYDPALTVNQNMEKAGWRQFWDCGSKLYVMKK